MSLSPQEAEALARLLDFLWPRKWLETEKGAWRCVLATRFLALGLMAAIAAGLIYLAIR